MRLRISLALVTLLAAITALTIGLGSAAAAPAVAPLPDPQTTNIPYVAWAGEQVRVVKCLDSEDTARALAIGLDSVIFRGKFRIEDWSGDVNQRPQFLNDQDGDVVAQSIDGRVCFSVHVTSLKPGLAVIKLAVRDDLLGLFPGLNPWLKHQFLVIFLRDQPASIVEVPTPGDPAGNGVFNPIPGPDGNHFLPGLVKLNVKGTFPLGNNFAPANSGIDFSQTAAHDGVTVTLPDDWAWLAMHFANDDTIAGSNFPGATPWRWDIHDGQSEAENHSAASICIDKLLGSTDAVDNCLGGPQDGTFSRLVGGTTDTIGPFDPLFPDETLLTDGILDANDAPMPALRLDVSLTDGSVGSLSKADKADIYIRDASKTAESPHNLYAPFYQSYIPSVTPDRDGSGVAGAFSNNFTGFLSNNEDGLYDFWDTFTVKDRGGFNNCKDVLGNPIPTPTGDQIVAVYTDEHGEAWVQFNPNEGLFLTPDSNNRCDIYHPGVLGTATIQALSVYPDQVVAWDQANKKSATLTKTVNHLANKTLACVPKGTNEAFCVETVVDIEGNPVAGVSVEFTAQASNGSAPKIQPDAAVIASTPYDTRGQTVLNATDHAVRLQTNALGQAGISVVSSTDACIDVDAENIGTRNGGAGIFRFTDFNPHRGTACSQGGGTGGTGTGTTTTTTTTSTTTTAAQSGGGTTAVPNASPVAISAPVPTAQAAAPAVAPAKVAKAQLVSAKVLKTQAGRYLQVRVNSASKVAKLRITLIGKNGKVSRVVLRSVATNHTVRVSNLKLAPSVRTVRVALA
jgi:hypothetical protein